jgi:hypothetical protein
MRSFTEKPQEEGRRTPDSRPMNLREHLSKHAGEQGKKGAEASLEVLGIRSVPLSPRLLLRFSADAKLPHKPEPSRSGQ